MDFEKMDKLDRVTVEKERKSRKIGYNIIDDNGDKIAFGAGNPLKYGFEFIVYEDNSLDKEIFKITQEDVLEGRYQFKIRDMLEGEDIGYIERHQRKRLSKDLWKIYDSENQQIGRTEEDSKYKAVIRKYIIGTLPRKYTILDDHDRIGTINQEFSINTSIYHIDKDTKARMDNRFLLSIIFCVDNL